MPELLGVDTMLLVSVKINNSDFIPVASDMYHILARFT